jgi:hypothetical protein
MNKKPTPDTVDYEWDIERSDEYGDIVDHDFTFRLPRDGDGLTERQVLVYQEHRAYGEKGWAYVTDGKLDEWFRDALERPIRKVPLRFHAQLAKLYEPVHDTH